MNVVSCFERARFNVAEIDVCKYPIFRDEDQFGYMESVFLLDTSRIMCFPYYREVKGKKYIEIYVWDFLLDNGLGYKRFVIQKDYRLTLEDEEMFLDYLKGECWIDYRLLLLMIQKVNREYPEIHLREYSDKRHVLLHLYHSLHVSGPKEILFKANLNILAAELEKVEGCNLIANSPQKIFNVQMGMLRALNSTCGLEILKNEECRVEASAIYLKYHNFIRGEQLNLYQWKYLQNQFHSKAKVEKKMLSYLGEISDDETYYTYLSYIDKKQAVDVYYCLLPQFPDVERLQICAYECDMLMWFIEHQKLADYRLRQKAISYERRYGYESESDKYIVKVPRSITEVLEESEKQHNCLYRYLNKMIRGDSIILFLREKRRPNDSLVTMEVKHENVISQAYRARNCPINEEETEFLTRYIELKNLKFDGEEY